jgi:acyl-CoA dehydrogenase
MAFDFSYDESQFALQQSARGLLRELPRRRRIGVEPTQFDPGLWATMAALGWPGIRVPAEYGGAGAGLEDCYPVLEELGRHMVDSPMLDTIFVTELLLAHGDEAQRASF